MAKAYGIPAHAVNPLGRRLRKDRVTSPSTTGTRARRRGVDRDATLRPAYAALAVPAGSIVEVYGWDSTRDMYQIRKPTAASGYPVGVATFALSGAGVVRIALSGEVNIYVGETVAIGDWLGPEASSWYARITCLGTLEALKARTGAGLTRARFLPAAPPPLVKLTADPSGGSASARWVDSDGDPTGDTETFIDASAW